MSKEQFLIAMRFLAASVSIISAKDSSGKSYAMTASSVTSLTIDPPSILFCVNKEASIHDILEKNEPLCVNILSKAQQEISNLCSSNRLESQRFENDFWGFKNNVGFIKNSQSVISCTVEEITSYGSHSVFIGNVVEVIKNIDTQPLLYGKGKYLDI